MGNVPYFPVFFRLEGRRILVAGGGTIACRRVRTLLNFQPKITVAAPVLCEELEQLAAEGRITVFRGKAQEAAFEDLFLFLGVPMIRRKTTDYVREPGRKERWRITVPGKRTVTFIFPLWYRRTRRSSGSMPEGWITEKLRICA